MKNFHHVSLSPIMTTFLFFSVLTLCKAGATIRIMGEPEFSVSSGVSTITLELKNGTKSWRVEVSDKGTVKPIEDPDGTIKSYSLNDNKSLFVVNIRPATQVNKIVAILASDGDDSVVLHDVGQKAAFCLKKDGYEVNAERIYARKALRNGLMLYYMPDTPNTSGFSFVFHFNKIGFSVPKSEIKPLT